VGGRAGDSEGDRRGDVAGELDLHDDGWAAGNGKTTERPANVWASHGAVRNAMRAGERERRIVPVWHGGVATGIRGEESSTGIS
jgi:hypothetical protein